MDAECEEFQDNSVSVVHGVMVGEDFQLTGSGWNGEWTQVFKAADSLIRCLLLELERSIVLRLRGVIGLGWSRSLGI